MATNLFKRVNRWFVRFNIPQERWADVGRALGSRSGERRDVVRTLGPGDYRAALGRRDMAMTAIRTEVDAALAKLKLRPLSDWTANWEAVALERREQFKTGQDVILYHENDPQGRYPDAPWTAADQVLGMVQDEALTVAERISPQAARLFTETALGNALSVAAGARQWLAEIKGTIAPQTWKGHEAALALLRDYLGRTEGCQSLEVMALSGISRRVAGEFIRDRRATKAAATVQREFSTYSGLWRWALRRGYTEVNPWTDQTAGLKAPRTNEDDGDDQTKRAYTEAELVSLLSAGADVLAPNRGGLGPALWDVIRLGLLTGARANELLSLTRADVIEDGTVIATPKRGKTKSAPRLIPLHAYAQAVIAARLNTLPDTSPTATLWPEVPAVGSNSRRAKTVSTRFIVVRRRILGEDDGADLHSLRRNFVTACETAQHGGGRLNADLISLIVGHKRGTMAADLYSEWTRLGRRTSGGVNAGRLATLRNAVDDAINLGLSKAVLKALGDTVGARPAVTRMAPAYAARGPKARGGRPVRLAP